METGCSGAYQSQLILGGDSDGKMRVSQNRGPLLR